MGSCIGRCFCEVGKCFCCDCVVFGSNLKDRINKRRPKQSQTFVLRRQSSSATIEFENLMFDFDLPDSSTSVMQMRPNSLSNWLSLKEDYKSNDLSVHQLRTQFSNPLSKSFKAIKTEITSEEQNRELPLIDSLISKTSHLNKSDSPDFKDKNSLGSLGASSLGDLQWENDMIADSVEHNGNELEWDNYDEDNIALHLETEQLISDIEEMTKSSSNQKR